MYAYKKNKTWVKFFDNYSKCYSSLLISEEIFENYELNVNNAFAKRCNFLKLINESSAYLFAKNVSNRISALNVKKIINNL